MRPTMEPMRNLSGPAFQRSASRPSLSNARKTPLSSISQWYLRSADPPACPMESCFGLARLDQDIDLLGTHRSRLGVGDDRDPCVLLGAARGLQYALLEIGYDILAGRDLDDARLYPRVTYALGELGHEDILHHVDQVLEPAAELEVRGAALAFGVEPRSAYDLDSRSLGQLLQE